MTADRPGPLTRLVRRFLLEPAGYGRPMGRATADREYRSGAWAHFHDAAELPRQEAVVDYIFQASRSPAILDIGCGSGRLAQLLQSHSFRRYVGLDFSPAGLAEARALQLRNCEFVEGDFATWRPAEKFDVIVFGECAGYAHDPGELVRSFLPWLAPGGVLVVSYYRSGHWTALWRRIEREVRIVAARAVGNDRGQVWDIKLLRP